MMLLGMAGVSAGLATLPVGGLASSAWAAKKSIRFDGWGGVVSEAFSKHAFKPFTKATGVEVIEGEAPAEGTAPEAGAAEGDAPEGDATEE